MKKYILLCLFALCNIYGSIAQNNDWFEIKDKDAAYLIDFPSEPEKGENDVQTDKGTVKMNTYTLQTSDDVNMIYMSSFTKYPESFFEDGLVSEESQNTVLDNSVNGAVTNTEGELILDKKITFNGYKGRVIKIKLSGGYIIYMKVLLVDIRLYLAQVIYEEKDDGNENAKRFFESLELINVKK
ncbi:MAG: hypothetical protein COA67_00320 [Lutibacter sp.]|nr:MAG: hypothetical protein COA67_00320 [Lutibacter sp.]